jgi:hypothetical protein
MDEIKKVVGVLIDQFIKTESGNKVTVNNMMALGFHISQALDGKITLTPPNQDKDADETNGNK